MAGEPDPYEILGISRGAGPEQIRQAYRRAALRCHPDNCRDDPAEAVARFRELTGAYRTALRLAGRTLRPEELSGLTTGWSFVPAEGSGGAAARHLRRRPGTQRLTFPTVNENLVFACFWAVAIALAVLAGSSLSGHAIAGYRGEPGAAGILAVTAVVLGIYAAVLAGTLAALVLTRKVVFLVLRVGLLALQALPGPAGRRKLPRA